MSPASSRVFEQVALRLRDLVRSEHANSGTGAERFKVIAIAPLRLEEMGGSLVLQEGDPDVTIGAWIRQYIANYGLRVGDEVWALREGAEWHIVDVADRGGQTPWAI